jgi:hypothetical protein
MKDKRWARGEGRVGCVIWLAIVSLIAYSLFKIVPVKIATSTFEDFLTEEASFGSIKSAKQIENEILAKAKDLEIPVTKENLTITRTREKIRSRPTTRCRSCSSEATHTCGSGYVVERPMFVV